MPISKLEKVDIKMSLSSDSTSDPCTRCDMRRDEAGGHETKHCPTPVHLCWKNGKFSDAKAAEEFYQAEKKKKESNLSKKGAPKVPKGPSTAPKSAVASPSKEDTAAQDVTNQIEKVSLNSKPNTGMTQAGSHDGTSNERSNKPRIPIEIRNVGSIDPQRFDNREQFEPKGVEVGLFNAMKDVNAGGNPSGPMVIINYINITALPKELFAYTLRFYREHWERGKASIEFNKQGEIKSAFNAFRAANKPDLHAVHWATDYVELWCTTKLSISHNGSTTFKMNSWNRPGAKSVDELKLDITFKQRLDISNVFKTKASCSLSEEIRALNAIISSAVHSRRSDLIQIGTNKFFVKNAFKKMAGGLRAQRGYFTSIRPSVCGPLLNINTATATFLPPVRVSDLLNACMRDCGLGSLVETRNHVERMLKNRVVRVLYIRQNYEGGTKDMNSEHSRRKIFKEFGKNAADQIFYNTTKDSFGNKVIDSEDTGRSVYDWFNRGMIPPVSTSKDTLCVNVGNTVSSRGGMREQSIKGALWIPANLLEIVPDQPTNIGNCPQHTSDMIRSALRAPGHNASLIDMEGLQMLGVKGTQDELKAMNVSAGNNLISFRASQSTEPQVKYGPKDRPRPHMAAWNLVDMRFAVPKEIGQLHVLSMTGAISLEEMETFAKDMAAQLKSHGMTLTVPQSFAERLDPRMTLAERLPEWFPCTKKNDCTVVVLDSAKEGNYAIIKRAGDITHGRHTLCLLGRKVSSKIRATESWRKAGYLQHLSNLVMKVNLKMQGDNHVVNVTGLGAKKEKTIVLGSDVTHPTGDKDSGRPSIACVVGSIDSNFMNYPGSMRLQAGGQEEIQDMRSMVRERLEAWQANHGGKALPEYMVFYRDGISESQFIQCEKKEIADVRAAFSDLCIGPNKGKKLQLAFIIVGKRHNTRFYPTRNQDCTKIHDDPKKRNMNLRPGLLVDSVIIDPDRTNFYLQSHQAIQGTARSAHYHVLVDDIGFDSNPTVGKLTDLTHQLCYAFGRATRGVSYVAPAYIADRLCERGRVYLRGWHGEGLPEKPKPSGERKKLSEEEIKAWKTKCAERVMREMVMPGTQTKERLWGHYNGDPAKGTVRLNPWHPNMDMTMFWM